MLSCKIFWRGSNENYCIDDTMIKAIRPPFLQGILVFNLIYSVLKKIGKLNNSLISLQENKNLNHHSIVGCTSGYKQTQELPSIKLVASFHYPFSRPEFLQKWITFTDRKDWTLNSFQRDVWETFSWRCYESRVTKSQPYPNEERTSLWKETAQWTKHWMMGKTTLD